MYNGNHFLNKGEIKMKNEKILEMLNNGEIEELKKVILEEIYNNSLDKKRQYKIQI